MNSNQQERFAQSQSNPDEIPRSAWLALGVTTFVFFLSVIDVSAMNVAFPSISEHFDVEKSQLSWIISGYNMTVASGLLLAGRLADSIGRKKVFLPGVAIFGIGSLLCGFAPSLELLIAARVVQAIGGAVVAASSLAVVLPDFPLSKRGTVIGIAGTAGALGAVAGPALGSFLIELSSWRAIFLINGPLILLVLAVSPKLLHESKDPNATGRIDLLGVPIGTAAIALIMFAIVQSESWGITDMRVVGLFLVGLALFPLLIYSSAHHPEPLLNLDLFKVRSFSSASIGAAFFSGAFTAGFLVNSIALQELWDQPITTTGLALMPAPLVAAFCSPFAGRYSDRYGHRWLLGIGSILCASGYGLYVLVIDETPAVFNLFVPISLIVGVGIGLSIASWSSAGLADISPSKFGVANATLRTVQQCFYALGIAVAITLISAGASRSELTGFRWAWTWVAGCYFVSALVIMWTFPPGSSQDRHQQK